MTLRTNQKNAIQTSLENDFASGVHFHATGTGKSWIALQLLTEFNRRPGGPWNILWICEQKSILLDQFQTDTLAEKGFGHIQRDFLIFDYSRDKPSSWASNVNSAAVWRKSLLVIINRAFLVSKTEYARLRIPFHLILHDECHSVTNTTTQAFYTHMLAKTPPPKCIGFSATPTTTHEPFKHVLSKYTIYDACQDETIVPPKIAWLNAPLTGTALRDLCATTLFKALPYKKILVWCGMIDLCYSAAAEWRADARFADMMVAVDTSRAPTATTAFADYEAFVAAPGNALLFCAGKHREGSDIPLLDGCIFLDAVAKRNHKTFIQCIGRVLRRDPAGKKTHGFVLDLNAKSPIEICSRLNSYLQPRTHSFPYRYSTFRVDEVQINVLDVVLAAAPAATLVKEPAPELIWRRPCPPTPAYRDRLAFELTLFRDKDLLGYLAHAMDILSITQHLPHVTRGSCGSSLVCYLLGISNIDPVKYDIEFARFLNIHRSTLPDIDFDFPHNARDDVFLQIYLKWPGRVARISNHVYYHEKSALRKAVQLVGIRKQISALAIRDVVRRLPRLKREAVHAHTRKLVNTFRTYSLHCGGIVFYPSAIPPELKLRPNCVLNQITLNKEQIAKNKQFKIDILASRALSQLFEARRLLGLHEPIDFDAHMEDAATAALFARGDNIGIILAESPLMRRTLRQIKPRTLEDVAKCLAIIRPAAKKARTDEGVDGMVYDDDVIQMIQRSASCDAAQADALRRLFTKTPVKELATVMKAQGVYSEALHDACKDLRKYSFCKSHAFSYAQLVWQLGYMKAHHPREFWMATLMHCQSSYRKWVHQYEARLAGAVLEDEKRHTSIYAKHRRETLQTASLKMRVTKLGSWSASSEDVAFYPECGVEPHSAESAQLRGLIASSRVLSYSTKQRRAVLLVGYGPRKYVEVLVSGRHLPIQGAIGISCVLKRGADGISYESEDYSFW